MSLSWWKVRIFKPFFTQHMKMPVRCFNIQFLSPTEAGHNRTTNTHIHKLSFIVFIIFSKLNDTSLLLSLQSSIQTKKTKPVTLYLQVVCLHATGCKSERGRRGHNTKTPIRTVNMPLYSFAQSDKSCREETLWRCDYSNLCFECRRKAPAHFCAIDQ